MRHCIIIIIIIELFVLLRGRRIWNSGILVSSLSFTTCLRDICGVCVEQWLIIIYGEQRIGGITEVSTTSWRGVSIHRPSCRQFRLRAKAPVSKTATFICLLWHHTQWYANYNINCPVAYYRLNIEHNVQHKWSFSAWRQKNANHWLLWRRSNHCHKAVYRSV